MRFLCKVIGRGAGFARIRSASRLLLVSLASISLCLEAGAVIIETGDGAGNGTAPPDDPGWSHLGTRGSLSAVYLGHRWVVTANHVGAGDVVFLGQTHAAVPGSTVRLENPDSSQADLIVYKIFGDPGLPTLEIAAAPLFVDQDVTLIGHGRNRGFATSWMGVDGYEWATSGTTMRWGTNKVSRPAVLVGPTRSFAMSFSDPAEPLATVDESTAAPGDSGGGAFTKVGSWQLAGIIIAINTYENQPSETSLYGNETFAVDLSYYRDDILAAITRDSCSDGLDDDGDGLADFPLDAGCTSASDDSEKDPSLPCDDGVDNDEDGLIDFPVDPQCDAPDAQSEAAVAVPALGLPGLGLLAGLMLAWGGSGSRRSEAHRAARGCRESAIDACRIER